MTQKKSGKTPPKKERTARGKQTQKKADSAPAAGPPPEAAADTAPPETPPPGLDDARHAAAQRVAHQAEVLRKGVFPALMASALSLDNFFETASYKLHLEQILEEAGNPTDPVERMMIEQLALAHLRIAQLHVGAGQAKATEAIKVYNAATARLWGEFRRTALALRAYRTSAPKTHTEKKERLKLYKMAQ